MSTIFLVRHGEAVGDESADPGLSEVGRAQVRALARRLAGESIDAVWHGPKRRARETGRLLAEQLEIGSQSTELLDDRTPVPSGTFRSGYTERRLNWFDGIPEEERDEDGRALSAAWVELCTRVGRGSVVMVTHSFVISQFVALALDAGSASWMRLAASPAGLSIIEADAQGDPVVRAFNETVNTRP